MASNENQSIDLSQMHENAAQAAALLRVMSNPNRLMILCLLLDKELSVGELQEAMPLSQSALSQHLAALRAANLVQARSQAQSKFYRLQGDEASAVIGLLHTLYCAQD